MKRIAILLLLVGSALGYTVTDTCTGTTSCSLAGTHAATDIVIVWAYRAGSTTAPSLATSHTNITNGSSATGASRSWRAGCSIAGSTGSVSTGTWTNATNIAAVTISGTGATSTANCQTNGIPDIHAANSVSSATATFGALNSSGHPPNAGIAFLVMGSSTSGNTCMPTAATSKASLGDVNVGIANANGNWALTTCTITSSVTTEIVFELAAPVLASPSITPGAGTYNPSVSEAISCSTGTPCITEDGTTPNATTPGTCSTGGSTTPRTVSSSETMKAICTAAANQNSLETDAIITISSCSHTLALLHAGCN